MALPAAESLFGPAPAPAPKPVRVAPVKAAPAATPPPAEDLFAAPAPAKPSWTPEVVMQYAGPGRITSTRRSAADNARVGGSKTSSHLTGHGIDFVPADGDFDRAARALADAGVPFDQIINEGDHIHIGYGPKMRGQFKPKGIKGGVLAKAEDLFGEATASVKPKAESLFAAAGRKGRDILDTAARRSGAPMLEEARRGWSSGDPLDMALAPLQVAGGLFQNAVALPASIMEETYGRSVEKGTGVRKEAVGDLTAGGLGLLTPGPKGARPGARAFRPTAADEAAAIPGVAREVTPEPPVPPAEELFPAMQAARGRAKPVTPLPPADDLFPKTLAAKVEDPLDDVLMAPRARREGTLSLPKSIAAEPSRGLVGALKEIGSGVQKVMAPATIGEAPEAARVLRRASAEADLEAAQTWTRLSKSADEIHFLPVDQQRALVNYIEGQRSGPLPAGQQRAADDIRTTMEGYRRRIEDTFANDLDGADGPTFVKDYYSHMWKEAPEFVEGRIAVSRQGSGRSLKARSIPTMQEGIEAGLTPKYENPIEATLVYASNMSRFLATVDAQADLLARGRAVWGSSASRPEGWVPLDGIRTTKPGRTIIKDGEAVSALPERRLYADPNVARVYNNWISKGFEAGDAGKPFEVARRAKNASVGLSLALSAWQATDVTLQSMLSEVARATQAASRVPGLAARGDLAGAGREAFTAGKAALSAPVAPIKGVVQGGRTKRALLNDTTDQMGDLERRAVEAYPRAGGRVRQDAMHKVQDSGAQSFYTAMTDGTMRSELDKAVKRIAGPDRLVSERAAAVADAALSGIQSLMDPMFSTYIPRMKMAAFKSSMEDWLRAHPDAPTELADTAAYEILRSIDNRMGDMAWDNLFWNQQLKQTMNLLYLSPKYTVGMINEYVGGLIDLAGPSAKGLVSGEGVTPRTAYALSSLGAMAMLHGAYQYMKTGERPEGMDFIAPRTGGTYTSRGTGEVPERAVFPGYGKDVYTGTFDAPDSWPDWLGGKMSPPAKIAGGLAANEDWRGNPIRDANAPTAEQAAQVLKYVATQGFAPYWVVDQAKGQKVGSNISRAESFLGVAPAPQSMQDRKKALEARKKRRQSEWERKRRTEARDAAQRE